MDKNTFVYVTFIETTPEKLWNALTSEEFTKKYWLGMKVVSDWKVGSPINLQLENGKIDWYGKILKFDPTNTLAHTFQKHQWNDTLKEDAVTKVTFDLLQKGPSMKLTITHEDLNADMLKDISGGWPVVLSGLKTVLETGKTLPIK